MMTCVDSHQAERSVDTDTAIHDSVTLPEGIAGRCRPNWDGMIPLPKEETSGDMGLHSARMPTSGQAQRKPEDHETRHVGDRGTAYRSVPVRRPRDDGVGRGVEDGADTNQGHTRGDLGGRARRRGWGCGREGTPDQRKSETNTHLSTGLAALFNQQERG